MRNLINKTNYFKLALYLAVVVFSTACSDDNKSTETSKNSTPVISSTIEKNKPAKTGAQDSHGKKYYKEMSQPLDKATWSEKGKFKKEFTEDCLVRETIDSKNIEKDRKRWEKPCECIADYMAEHLTDEEAEEYLADDNHTRSLQIRFEAAAYNCLQKNEQPISPKIIKH